jgi:uncharacterized membrane protein YbaN (DUF454 family)
MKKAVKPLFLVLGFLAFVIGTAGIFLPVLPTAPLYMLTVYCFARGSDRFYNWFLSTRLYKKHLDSYVNKRAMSLKTKVTVLSMVSVILTAAIWFAPIWHAQALMAAVLLWHWWYFIFRVKTEVKEGVKC